MADGIVIEIDLDSQEYRQKLKRVQEETETSSKKTGESLEKNISKVLDNSVNNSVNNAANSITKLNTIISKMISTSVKLIPIAVILEKRFGTFSALFSKIGIDIGEVAKKFNVFIETFAKFAVGEKNLLQLKIAMGLLLRQLGLVDSSFLGLIDTFGKFSFQIENSVGAVSSLAATSTLLVPLALNFSKITSLFQSLGNVLLKGKGFFGFISAISGVSVGLYAISKALEETNNKFLNAVGFVSKFSAVLLGGLAAGLTYAVIKISELAEIVGTKLVGFFVEASNLFNTAEQSLDTFSAVVDSVNRSVKGGIGLFSTWEAVVGLVANTFNFTRDEIRKSAQEILLVGPKLGLVEDQMRQLIKVSAEYAKINKKDVFQTTVNFVNALNGNAQAVAALGVKLTQTSLQQYAYTKGMTSSIDKMSEGEKVQLRFNKVLSQYKEVAGIGVVAANSLAEASKRLKIQQERLQTALGQGARIIEQNNILAFIYDKALGRISTTMATLAGFFGALGARLLQFGGIFFGLSFKIYAVIKAFKLLKALLSSEIGIKAFATNIPLLNKSLNQLLSNLSNTNVEVNSLGSLMQALANSAGGAFGNFVKSVASGNGIMAATFTLLKSAISSTRTALIRLYALLSPFLVPLLQVAVVVGAIVGAFLLLKKGFEEVEKRTGALSALWEVFSETLSGSTSLFDPVIEFFSNVTEGIKTLVSKGFGLFVSGLTSVISVVTALVKKNPFGVFSQDSVDKITALDNKLKGFQASLAGVGFDMRRLGDDMVRSLAGGGEASRVNLEEVAKNLNAMREKYAQYGMSQVQILQAQQAAEYETLKLALDNKLLLNNEYLLLKDQMESSFREKLLVAEQEAALAREATFSNTATAFQIHASRMTVTAGQLAKTMLDLSVRGFGNAFQRAGAALANGGNAMQAFADATKAAVADAASALADYYIIEGTGRIAKSYGADGTGYQMIAAGAGLKLLAGALGSSSTSAGTAGSGGGVSTGSGGFQDSGTGQITEARAERPEADTNLSVVINGDVLDGQETGNRIVDVLGDTFSKEGVVLRDVRFA